MPSGLFLLLGPRPSLIEVSLAGLAFALVTVKSECLVPIDEVTVVCIYKCQNPGEIAVSTLYQLYQTFKPNIYEKTCLESQKIAPSDIMCVPW